MPQNSYMCVESVGHQFKFTIRRNERNCAVILKSRQTDTLMKLDILQFYCFALASCEKTKYVIFLIKLSKVKSII